MTGRLALAVITLIFATSAAAAPPSWPSLDRPPASVGGGAKDAAVVVGIERYYAVPPVPGARQNATDWFAWLTETRKVPYERVHLLRDGEGSKEKLLHYAKRAAEQVKPGGTLWFVFIGHGAPAKDLKDGLLVGVDASQDAMGLYSRSVPQKTLVAALERGKQAQTLMVVDACFSGRAADGRAIVEGLQPLVPVKLQASKATLLTAGKSSEFAGPLPGVGRPAFSYLVLGALRGWGDADKDGRVTASEALHYARRALLAVVKDRNQTPQLFGEGAEGVLATGVKEEGPHIGSIIAGRDVRSRPAAPPAPPSAAPPPAAPVEQARATPTAKCKPPKVSWRDKCVYPGEAKPAPELSAKDLYRAGRKLLSQGDKDGALALFQKAAAKGYSKAYKLMANIYLQKGMSAKAKEMYKKYLRLRPGASDAESIKAMIIRLGG